MRRLAGVFNRLQKRLSWQIVAYRDVRGHSQLGIADVLRGHVCRDLVGKQAYILGRLDQSDNVEIVPDEMREVVEDEGLRQLIRIARHDAGMPSGQFRHSSKRHRTDVVDMQLSLGKTGYKAFRDRHAAQSLTEPRQIMSMLMYVHASRASSS